MTKKQRIKTSTFTGLDVVKGVSLHRILEATCKELGTTVEAVKSKIRTLDVTYARHIFCYVAYNGSTHYSLKQMGKEINRDHASVIHGKTRISNQIDLYKPVYDHVNLIKDTLTIFSVGADYDNKLVTKAHVGYYTTPERKRELKEWSNENDVVSKSKVAH